MRRISSCLLSAAVACGMCAPAFAAPPTPTTHYRWTDASGVVHFGDTIPSSALAGGYDIVNAQGMVVRHVERELTPAERRAATVPRHPFLVVPKHLDRFPRRISRHASRIDS